MTTAVAPVTQNRSIRDYLNSPGMLAEIGKVLPKHCTPERMIRVACTAITKTPKLANCTKESFFECLLNLSQWGLEPDGRRAHLIPYGNKCTLVVDYKGYVELAYRSGVAKNIHASVVYRGDVFEYSRGKVIDHKPWDFLPEDDRPKERGEVTAAYCIVEMSGGAEHHEIMTKAEVESIRSRSKAGNNGPWQTDWNEMAKKTVFRRASKWIPMSAEIRDAFERDDDLPPIRNHGGLSRAPALDLGTSVIEGEVSLQEQFSACETNAEVKQLRERLGAAAESNEAADEIDRLATEAEVRIHGSNRGNQKQFS